MADIKEAVIKDNNPGNEQALEKCIFNLSGGYFTRSRAYCLVPAIERSTLNEQSIPQREQREAEEMMVIARSYAACEYLGIDADFVFHDNGYKGEGCSIADNFKNGHYFGVPMLQWVGMALEKRMKRNRTSLFTLLCCNGCIIKKVYYSVNQYNTTS